MSEILKEYKGILKKEGFTGKDMASILGMNYSSYRSSTRNKRKETPKWVGTFVLGYNLKELRDHK